MSGERTGGCEEFRESHPREYERSAREGARGHVLVEQEERGEIGKNWLQCEKECGMSRGKMLLGPTLDSEGGGSRKQTGNREGDEKGASQGQVGPSSQWKRD